MYLRQPPKRRLQKYYFRKVNHQQKSACRFQFSTNPEGRALGPTQHPRHHCVAASHSSEDVNACRPDQKWSGLPNLVFLVQKSQPMSNVGQQLMAQIRTHQILIHGFELPVTSGLRATGIVRTSGRNVILSYKCRMSVSGNPPNFSV